MPIARLDPASALVVIDLQRGLLGATADVLALLAAREASR
jgi:hypothetical protein